MNYRILKNKSDRFTAYLGLPQEVVNSHDIDTEGNVFICGIEITFRSSGLGIIFGEKFREDHGLPIRGWNLSDHEKSLEWIGWVYLDEGTHKQAMHDLQVVKSWFDSFIEFEPV